MASQPTADQNTKPPLFEARVSLLFFAMFVPVGVHVPYFPLWLDLSGFDAAQIAVILAAPQFLRLVTTPYVTSLADRAPDRAYVMIAVIAATLALSAGYFLPPTYVTVLAVSVMLHVFWSPHSPLADSIALSGVRRFGSNYSRMRIWGSIAFLVGNLLGGLVLSRFGPGIIPTVMSLGLIGALVVACFLPRLGRPRRPSPLSAAGMQAAGPSLFNRHFLLLVSAAGIIHSTHSYLFSFGSIYWTSIGISDAAIGVLWASAVVAEVCMFLVFTRVLGHASTSTLLLMAGAAAILRWVLFPLVQPSGTGVSGFLATQALHAVSTALVLLGVQKIIAESVGEERTGAAQGIAFFANGLAFALVTLASGPIYAGLGVHGFFIMAGVAAFGIALVLLAGSAPQRPIGR
ncbi:MAG: MFS transporter [Rhizobiaceae bacterium]|nr:MFS transporter [Rhizobiaceae bacterium]